MASAGAEIQSVLVYVRAGLAAIATRKSGAGGGYGPGPWRVFRTPEAKRRSSTADGRNHVGSRRAGVSSGSSSVDLHATEPTT
jgi:hypothetical protein